MGAIASFIADLDQEILDPLLGGLVGRDEPHCEEEPRAGAPRPKEAVPVPEASVLARRREPVQRT